MAKEEKKSIEKEEKKVEEKLEKETKKPKEEKTDKTSETKKLDIFKETDENKKALAEADGKSLPAVSKIKDSKEDKKKEKTTELEREYIIPLKRSVLKVPQYRRAKKAVKTIKEFLAKHMRVEDRDTRKVKVDIHLNNEVWFRGIKKPMNKVKVKAVIREGIVYAELAELPDHIKFLKAREEKTREKDQKAKESAKPVEHEHDHTHDHEEDKKEDNDKDKDGVKDSFEKKEKAKAGAEAENKKQKTAAKAEKHTAKGAHQKKTAPVTKKLK